MIKSEDGAIIEDENQITIDITKTSNWTVYGAKKATIFTEDLGKVHIIFGD